MLAAFIAQFYDDKPPPPLVLVSHALPEQELVAEALALKAGRKVEIAVPQRGEKRAVVEHAEINAREALERKLAETAGQAKLLEGVAQLFGLPATPERIEVYDNSHIMGTNPYGVMIVAGPEGFLKAAYRKFAIRGPITPGDDFAMMREVLQRRFARAIKEQSRRRAGQRLARPGADRRRRRAASAARGIMQDLGVNDVKLVAIAKGPDRDAGREWFHTDGQRAVPAAAARPGAVFPAAAARRGAPLRHHHPPRRPLAHHPPERARRDRRHRRRPQARAAQPFRLGARREDGGSAGPRSRPRHQPRDGAAGLCAFPPRRPAGRRVLNNRAPHGAKML